METTPEKLDTWALVELMGHNQIVGRVSETAIAGGAFIRVDVPLINGSQAYTRFFNPSSVYSLNPVTEEVARGLLTQSRFRNEPVQQFDLPKQLSNPNPEVSNCPKCGQRWPR